MEETNKLRLEVEALRSEFRIFRDNHFYHFERSVDNRFDKLEDTLKDRKLWLATGATFIIVLVDLLSHL